VGGEVNASVRSGLWSLELDGRAVGPSSAEVAGGTVSAWAAALALAPCRHVGSFAACVVGSAGVLRGGAQGFAIARSTTLPTFSAGARAVWEQPVGERWWLRAGADFGAVIGRAHLLVDGNEAWVSPRINATLVIGAGARFR
jgi:hypothetical protein